MAKDKLAIAKEKLEAIQAIKRRIFEATKADQEGTPNAQCGDLVERAPLLHSLLFMHFLDGGPEDGATVTFWGDSEGIGALLNVKAWNRKAFFRAGSLVELWELMEGHIGNPEAKWQGDKPKRSPRRPSGRQKH